ncbi:hypothetical protein KUF71_006523 [Frankliniella fusca]|uniref:BEN domain-containing protein n=1 Tax=Frankliniella fusca TaxID=407009 RepID=A0AAE1LTU4_9NEOP|nr:hypothetical protein KUF71_006523 [Frankliniella fusca]
MASTRSSKSKYYLVCAPDGYYCVPTRDMRTADSSNVQVEEQVKFKYGSHTKAGQVTHISYIEDDVIAEMKRLAKSHRPSKDDSFHDDRPRRAAMKQRQFMKGLQQPSSKAAKSSSKEEGTSLDSASESKKERRRKKETTQMVMECEMIGEQQSSTQAVLEDQVATKNSKLSSPAGSNTSKCSLSEASSASINDTSSNSSVDPKGKINRFMAAVDVNKLKQQIEGSDSDNEPGQNVLEENLHSSPERKPALEDPPMIIDSTSPAVSSALFSLNGKCPQPSEDLLLKSPTVKSSLSPHVPSDNVPLGQKFDKTLPSLDSKEVVESVASGSGIRKRSRSKSSSAASSCCGSRSSSCASSSSEGKKHKKSKHKKSKKTKKLKIRKSHKKSRKLDSDDDEDREDNITKNCNMAEDGDDRDKDLTEKHKTGAGDSSRETGEEDEGDDKVKEDSESDVKKKKKKHADKKEKHKKKKKGKKSKKSKKSSKKYKKQRGVKRNLAIYPGKMFLHSSDTPNAILVHEKFPNVFIPKDTLEKIVSNAKSLPLMVKHLIQNVFTKEALTGSTAQGFPNRVQGTKKLRQKDVLPRLDPDGREAILRRFTSYFHLERTLMEQENNKKWRPRVKAKNISQYFSQAVGDEKAQAKYYACDDSSSSSDSSSDSSSSDSSDSSSE